MRPDNPVKGVERNQEHKRKRYLSGEELARLTEVLAAHEDREAADIVRLLLLTGCRRGEAMARAVGRPRPDGRDLDQAGELHQAAHRSRLAAVGARAAAAGRDTRLGRIPNGYSRP